MALERLFRRRKAQATTRDVPELWTKCQSCDASLYKKDLDTNWNVCPTCGFHMRLSADKRVELLVDAGSFVKTTGLKPTDPLSFNDNEPYSSKLERYQKDAGRPDAIVGGRCTMGGVPAMLMVMDYGFAGGSMGSVVGEEITRALELAATENRAMVMVCVSGGARMQESVLSLMQMAKTTLALDRLWSKRLPYITILTDPTTGGVTASFAALGDVIFAEPGALIGFAGPRVIKQTIRQELPEGFQRAEFLLSHGMVDQVCNRLQLKDAVSGVLRLLHPTGGH